MNRKYYWGLAALIVFVIAAGGFIYWQLSEMQQFKKQAVQETAEAEELLRQLMMKKSKKVSKTGNKAEQATSVTPAESKTLTAEQSLIKTAQNETESSAETTETANVPVSPFGFGTYPEIPVDYPFNVNWESKNKRGELAARVMIKAWSKGERFVGAKTDGETGKLYLNYPNTVYVQYTETVLPNGSIYKTRRVSGPSSIVPPPLGTDFPPDIRVLDYDSEGIDPYEYLGISP